MATRKTSGSTAHVARVLCALVATASPAWSQAPAGHYLFAWAGDVDKQGKDFLAVIDADPRSPAYGHLVTAVMTDQVTGQVHHTEYTMPAGGMLFANDHVAGRTFIFDVQDPLKPTVAASFDGLGGLMHPHSFLRLPNGHVIASFQHGHMHHADGAAASAAAGTGIAGGIAEIDDAGQLVRAASTADPSLPNANLMAYSLLPLPDLDRLVVTNSSMHDADPLGHTYQVWKLSSLELLRTELLDTGGDDEGDINPEEPRLGPDGSVFVQTLNCGLERITGIGTDHPQSKLVHMFPGSRCGVPTVVGHYWVQSVPRVNGLVVLDIADPAHPVVVSRLALDPGFVPHWTGWDPKAERLVVTGVGDVHRLYLLTLDAKTGAIALDAAFRGQDGKPGFDFDGRTWPDGWKGSANAHGVVFSR